MQFHCQFSFSPCYPAYVQKTQPTSNTNPTHFKNKLNPRPCKVVELNPRVNLVGRRESPQPTGGIIFLWKQHSPCQTRPNRSTFGQNKMSVDKSQDLRNTLPKMRFPGPQQPSATCWGGPWMIFKSTYVVGCWHGARVWAVRRHIVVRTHKATSQKFTYKTINKCKVQILYHLPGRSGVVEFKGTFEDKKAATGGCKVRADTCWQITSGSPAHQPPCFN
jgi:hypothetical protein